MGTAAVTVTAAVTYVRSVNSAAPSSGIAIAVSPVDISGAGNGNTAFTRTYSSGTAVTLTAPSTSGGYSLVSWSGCASKPSANVCDVTMNANATVTATYNQTSITSIVVSPASAVIGTQPQFTATVNGTGNFSKSVNWSLSCPSCSGLNPGTLSASGLHNTPYPAPQSVVVTATSTEDTSVSDSATVTLSPPVAATGPDLSVDVNAANTPSENPHAISPLIYGVNGYGLDPASARIANPTLLRWGGDDTSRYNYKNTLTNSASDWYLENFQGGGNMYPNASGSTDFNTFVSASSTLGAASLGTVPVLGWVSNGTNACSYNTSLFSGQQTATNDYNGIVCGSGLWADGANDCTSSSGCEIGVSGAAAQTQEAEVTRSSAPAPDVTAASTPAPGSVTASWADSTWAGSWVDSVAATAGYGDGASGQGVAIWDLDNEPTWWDAVDRDVHPVAFTYDEVTNNGIGTALAIKTADPTALVSGPVIDYWFAYFYSKKDIENGWGSGPCYQPWDNPVDREAHGGTPLIEYYLQQFQNYSQKIRNSLTRLSRYPWIRRAELYR